jgi:hypothetical protein
MQVLKVHYYPGADGCQKKLVIYKNSSLALRTADATASHLDGLLTDMPLWQRVIALEQLFEHNPKLMTAAIAANQNFGNAQAMATKTNRLRQVAENAEKASRTASQNWLEAENEFREANRSMGTFIALMIKTVKLKTK